MDERKEILQDTIDRLIETALQELDQKLPEAGCSLPHQRPDPTGRTAG